MRYKCWCGSFPSSDNYLKFHVIMFNDVYTVIRCDHHKTEFGEGMYSREISLEEYEAWMVCDE
jgi:hypothetical protein